jgi:hypothetical protein
MESAEKSPEPTEIEPISVTTAEKKKKEKKRENLYSLAN